MKLTKTIKVLIGLGTILNILAPLLGIIGWLVAVLIAAGSTGSNGGDPTWLFPIFFFLFLPLILLASFSSLVLVPVYLVHIIKNNAGKDLYRILTAIGLHYLPWLAMPFYFLVYIWPDNPPAWALAEPAPIPLLPVKAQTQPERSIPAAAPQEESIPEPDAPQEAGPEPEVPLDATVVSWEGPAASEEAAAVLAGAEPLPPADEPAAAIPATDEPETDEWVTGIPESNETPADQPSEAGEQDETARTVIHTVGLPAQAEMDAIPAPEAPEVQIETPAEVEGLPAADEPAAADEWVAGLPGEDEAPVADQALEGEQADETAQTMVHADDLPLHPDLAAIPAPEAPEEAEEQPEQTEPEPPADDAPSSTDVTMVGPSPLDKEPGDED